MHCDAEGRKTASGGDRLALDEFERLAEPDRRRLAAMVEIEDAGSRGEGSIAATPAQCFRGGCAEHGRNPIGQAA